MLVTITVVAGQQARNSQWLDETIDEFLRNAQNADETTDIQISTCKISSQQLVATAQATAARVLKGVCNPRKYIIIIFDCFNKIFTIMNINGIAVEGKWLPK